MARDWPTVCLGFAIGEKPRTYGRGVPVHECCIYEVDLCKRQRTSGFAVHSSQFAVRRSQLSQLEVAVAESETLSRTKYSGVYADVTRRVLQDLAK